MKYEELYHALMNTPSLVITLAHPASISPPQAAQAIRSGLWRVAHKYGRQLPDYSITVKPNNQLELSTASKQIEFEVVAVTQPEPATNEATTPPATNEATNEQARPSTYGSGGAATAEEVPQQVPAHLGDTTQGR